MDESPDTPRNEVRDVATRDYPRHLAWDRDNTTKRQIVRSCGVRLLKPFRGGEEIDVDGLVYPPIAEVLWIIRTRCF